MGRPSPSQSVDRFIGVLVVVCASAVIVGLSVRAGSSLSSILRVAFDTANGRDGKSTGRRRRRSASSRAGQGRGAPREDEEADDAAEGEGDAYYAYAYGARSGRGPHGKGSGGRLVVHRGSCHCGELTFEVDAPEHLVAIEGPGKGHSRVPVGILQRVPDAPRRGRASRFSTSATQSWLWSFPCEGNNEAAENNDDSLTAIRKTIVFVRVLPDQILHWAECTTVLVNCFSSLSVRALSLRLHVKFRIDEL